MTQLGGSATVLVVDDDSAVLEFVRRVLDAEGFRVLEASGGQEAVDVAKQYPGALDLLVADLQMPDLNGMAVAKLVRSTRRDIKVLYLTGFPDGLFANRSMLESNTAFLAKPCTRAGLLEAVRLILTGRLA